MTLFDLLIAFFIGYFLWKLIKVIMSPSSKSSMMSEDGRPLTDTQIRFRQQTALYNEANKDQLIDHTQHFTSEQQKLIEMSRYVQENIRPFNWIEWLISSVDSRLAMRYILNMSTLFIFMIAVPLYMDWLVMTTAFSVFVVFYDWLMYRQQRLLEVTIWNPEFREKFSKQ